MRIYISFSEDMSENWAGKFKKAPARICVKHNKNSGIKLLDGNNEKLKEHRVEKVIEKEQVKIL